MVISLVHGLCRAPEALVEWGTLRQLHTTLNRCIGPHLLEFDVIMRKMLEVVRALPFSADDVHNTRNAHGTFADTLRELADRRQAARSKAEKVGASLLPCERRNVVMCIKETYQN